MWIEKLLAGVLRVLTPLGPRYIRPALAQRIYLLWIFRNFKVLPLQVLTPRQRHMIDVLCVDPRFVAPTEPDGWGSPHPGNPGAPPAHGSVARRARAGIDASVGVRRRSLERRTPVVIGCSESGFPQGRSGFDYGGQGQRHSRPT